MKLTLNIIMHELSTLGRIVRTQKRNPNFEGFRLYTDAVTDPNPDVLYLCSTRADVGKAIAANLQVAYVNPNDPDPDERAVFSMPQGVSPLVVFNALLDTGHRFAQWKNDMDKVRYTGGSLQELLDVSTGFLRNNVVIVDPALKLLAYSKDVPCDDPITVELINHGYHTEENVGKFKLHKRFKPWTETEGFVINDSLEICKYVTVVKSFKTRSSFSLITVMMCNVVGPEDWLMDIYEIFTRHVEYYALRDYPDDKPAGNATDTFLKDLFLGELNDPSVVQERCKLVGVPYEARFCLFYMKANDDSVPASRLLSDVSRVVAPAKTVMIADAIIALCFSCRNERCASHCESDTCPLGRRSLSSRINEMMERYDMVCGRSTKFTELSSAAIAFNQGKEAYRLGSKKTLARDGLGVKTNWPRIYSFDTCNVDYVADRLAGPGLELLSCTYASKVVNDIAEQDAISNTDNYRFLYAYLLNERRASVVAETLHMHRNNVSYRIGRIEEQYGIDTSDPILRFDLLMAFRLREAAAVQA